MWSSDHGFFLGEHRFYDKRLMYEPSIRIPLMVRYPPRIRAGSASPRMALNLDLAPRLLDLAQVRPCRGLRTEPYKYIHYFIAPEEFELYDLEADPAELRNLYGDARYAGLTRQLAARLQELRRETGDHYVYTPTVLGPQDRGCDKP